MKMSRQHLGHYASILTLPILLAGCGSILPTQAYVPRVDWPLVPMPPTQHMPNPQGRVVLLRLVMAGPGLDQRGVATLDPTGAIKYDYYNQWAVDPAVAVTGDLGQWLAASGAFGAVIDPASRLSPDLIVEGQLTEFVADGASHRARATLTLTVLRNSNGTIRLLGQRRFQGAAALADLTPAEVVRSQRAALADILAQSVRFVAGFS